MNKKKPILIVLTPVFNEAWILPAFLKATSLWADYIIIADQMSTDGSRDLYAQYPKVKVIDNPLKEMHQAATRRLLFEEVKKIEGDKILFSLDADEFLSGNFPKTEGWKTIINSEPGDVFEFKWMVIDPTCHFYRIKPEMPFYWAAHVNDEIMNGMFPDNFIHEWRLPWPKNVNHEYKIEDIHFLHFCEANYKREANKNRFYKVMQYTHSTERFNPISLSREYIKKPSYPFELPPDAYEYYEKKGLNLLSNINLADEGEHYSRAILDIIEENGITSIRKLDIWDDNFTQKNNLIDPRRPIDKIMHWFLKNTQKISKTFMIRSIDYILKRMYR